MATWNTAFEASPAGSDVPSEGDDKIRELKGAVRERLDKEHVMNLSSGLLAEDGWHESGSAKAYIQASAPTTRPDGTTALSSADNGRIWIGSTNNTVYVYDHSAGGTNADRWVARGVISGNSLKGYESVTLTAHDTASAPSVASGSVIEVNGTYYALSGGAAMNGTAASGLNYIKFTASGDTVYPYWTQSASSWSDSKQGWYSGNDRYLFSCYYDGTNYLDKQKLRPEQIPSEFIKPFFIASQAADLEFDGTSVQERNIYCKNLHVTANTELRAKSVIVEGNMIIDSGVTLECLPLIYRDYRNFGTAGLPPIDSEWNFWEMVSGGQSGTAGTSDADPAYGCLGGGNSSAAVDGANRATGGGGSITNNGGNAYAGGTSGAGSRSVYYKVAIGGAGASGDGGPGGRLAAGGGAGPGGGGGAIGSQYHDGKLGGIGGAFVSFIIKGSLINNGTISANGQPGEGTSGATNHSSGGGGGGLIMVFCFGDICTFGTIEAKGGMGNRHSTESAGGGGGGGGHIHAVGKTAVFTGLDVSGGLSGGGTTTPGGTGTTEEINISVNPKHIFGTDDNYNSWIFNLIDRSIF